MTATFAFETPASQPQSPSCKWPCDTGNVNIGQQNFSQRIWNILCMGTWTHDGKPTHDIHELYPNFGSFRPNSTHWKYLNVYKHLDDYLAINTFSLRSLGMSPVMFNRSSRSPLNCVWKAPNCVIAPKINRYPTLSLLVLIVSIYSGHSTLTTCVVIPCHKTWMGASPFISKTVWPKDHFDEWRSKIAHKMSN